MIVCTPNCGFLSGPSRMIAVYKALIASGMNAALATHGGPYEFVFDREGVPYRRLGPPMTSREAAHNIAALTNPAVGFCRTETLHQRVLNEIAFFQECGAEAVVSEFALSTALSARAAGVPLFVTHLGSFVPIVSERGVFRFGDCYDTLLRDCIPAEWFDRLVHWLMGLPNRKVQQMNAVARRLGITPIRSYADLILGDVTLVTDVPQILGISNEDLEAWRPSNSHRDIRPTARLMYAGPIYAELWGEVPDDVREFLAATTKPRVYVALASTEADRIARVCSTIDSSDLCAVVVTTIHEGRFSSSPNILFKPLLPSHKVMPLCDLAIIHGGQGSVQSAIASGVPLIGIPLQPEQFFNVKRIEQRGAGRCVSLRQFEKGMLCSAIQDVLANPDYRASMGNLQRLQALRNGPAEVVRAVQKVACERVRGTWPSAGGRN